MAGDQQISNGQFLIRVRKGDWEVEVSAPDKSFVLDESDRLIELVGNHIDTVLPLPKEILVQEALIQEEASSLSEPNLPRNSKPQTLNEFYRQFKLQTNLDKILVFGYWSERRQGQPHFTSEDILAKYKEAKQPPPANLRRDIGNLVSKGFFMDAGRSEGGALAYELTATGIEEVESKLPRL